MAEYNLGKILRERYENAGRNCTMVELHLFGIDYASVIKANHYNIKDIVKAAGLKEAYSAEISKGVKLSDYVERKGKKDVKRRRDRSEIKQ